MFTELKKTAHYDGLKTNPIDCDWVLFGAPFDATSSYRKGSRLAPNAIREETIKCQETYSLFFDCDIETKSVADIGDLELNNSVGSSLSKIEFLTSNIYTREKKAIMIGGEHLVTLPMFKSVFEKYPELRIIHLDAHADMIDVLFDRKLSHGTVMRRIWEILGDQRIYQFGIRSGSKEELDFAKSHCIVTPFNLDGIESFIPDLANFPIYLTVDLDCFDPSQIPGTGTPETGGVFFKEYLSFLRKIKNLNIVAIDINECAPNLDVSGMSTIFAAKVIRETIAACI